MQITNYDQAVKYLEGFIGKVRFEITPEFLKHHDPLERMRVLLSLLGNPQNKFKSILVGGTSGKGSTAYLISHILTTAGYKTGLTISPHLQKINERLQINGKSISDEEFVELLNIVIPAIEKMKKMKVGLAEPWLSQAPQGSPSYFEILIAMAFLYFAKAKVEIAVVEVGMGGEFDATNTLYPLVAALTNVSLDHTNILGGTVQEIAKTKAGIIKDYSSLRSLRQFGDSSDRHVSRGSILARVNSSKSDSKDALFKSAPHAKAPRELIQNLVVVTGVKQPSVIKIVEDRCEEVGAKLYRLRKDLPAGRQGFDFKIKKESLEGTAFDLIIFSDRRKRLNNLELSLLGRYQVENASLAIETVRQLADFGFKVSEEHIRIALKTAFFPGRFEIIQADTKILRYKDIKSKKNESPSILISQYPNIQIVLDGAHNPTKMKAFLTTLKKLYPKQKKVFVVGFKFDKDIPKMLKQITKVADTVIITEFDRATDMSVSASAEPKRILEDIKRLGYYDIKRIVTVNDSRKALDKALNISVSQYPNIPAIIVVTGSLYLVGEIRNML